MLCLNIGEAIEMNKDKRKFIVPLAISTLLLSGGIVQAAPADADNTGIEMRRQREEAEWERIRQQMEDDRRAQQENIQDNRQKKEEQSGDNVKLLLKDVQVDSSAIISEEKIKEIIAPYVGREVSIADLNEMVDKFNEVYAAGGYVTCKAYLPLQKITEGIVHVGLIEGTVGEVSISGNKHTSGKYVRHRLSLSKGQIPNIHILNKEIYRFNVSNDAPLHVTMQAGKEQGTTDYEIIVREPPKNDTVFIFADNSGSISTGEWREGLYYTRRSLTGRRDALSLGYSRAKGMDKGNLSYATPIGRNGGRLFFDYSSSVSKMIADNLRALDSRGHGWYAGISYLQPLIVNNTTRTEFRVGGYHQKSQTDMLQGAQKWIDNRANNLYLSFAMTSYGKSSVFYHRHYYGIGHINAYNTAAAGYNSRDYGLYRMNGFYQKVWKNGHTFSARLDMQLASRKDIPSAEQFFLGGVNSVRGYKQDIIGGDNGLSGSLEYALPLDRNRRTMLYGFFDYGTLLGDNDYEDNQLESLGLGVRSSLKRKADSDQSIFLNLSVGFPLKRELNMTTYSKCRVDFSMSMQF